ncbi:MAG: hypothetical protein HS111_17710 [Kofleriaceae bacterium]|nr:hypothetical protein [Kofleriaceae bacterium]
MASTSSARSAGGASSRRSSGASRQSRCAVATTGAPLAAGRRLRAHRRAQAACRVAPRRRAAPTLAQLRRRRRWTPGQRSSRGARRARWLVARRGRRAGRARAASRARARGAAWAPAAGAATMARAGAADGRLSRACGAAAQGGTGWRRATPCDARGNSAAWARGTAAAGGAAVQALEARPRARRVELEGVRCARPGGGRGPAASSHASTTSHVPRIAWVVSAPDHERALGPGDARRQAGDEQRAALALVERANASTNDGDRAEVQRVATRSTLVRRSVSPDTDADRSRSSARIPILRVREPDDRSRPA